MPISHEDKRIAMRISGYKMKCPFLNNLVTEKTAWDDLTKGHFWEKDILLLTSLDYCAPYPYALSFIPGNMESETNCTVDPNVMCTNEKAKLNHKCIMCSVVFPGQKEITQWNLKYDRINHDRKQLYFSPIQSIIIKLLFSLQNISLSENWKPIIKLS